MRDLLGKFYQLPKWVLFIFLCCYYLSVVLPHEWVGKKIAFVFDPMGRNRYDFIILVVSIAFLLWFVWQLVQSLKHTKVERIFWTYFVSTILFAIVSYNILFTLNIEFVHFLQYGAYVLFCFPLVNNFYKTWVWAGFAGIADEIYQYTILAPQRTQYFDFNDVVMNMVGAAMGVLLLRMFGFESVKFKWRQYITGFQAIILSICLCIVVILFVGGVISLRPDDQAIFVLVKKPYPGFWSKVPPNVVFHIIKPLEGVLLMLFLYIFYRRIDDI